MRGQINIEKSTPERGVSPGNHEGHRSPVAADEKLRLYVVTVNYNSEPHVKRLIESLSSVDSVEKLVVVNHSPGNRLEALRADFPIQVIQQPNRGYGAGLNRGLQEIMDANGLVLLCNPDIVIVNHEAIEDAWRYMKKNPGVGIAVPALVDANLQPVASCRKFFTLKSVLFARIAWIRRLMPKTFRDHYYAARKEADPLEVDWASGAAMFVHASASLGLPLFDERFFLYFEDVDLCARMWQENRPVVCFPYLTFQHCANRLSHKGLKYFFVHVASLMKFMLKYRGLPQRTALLENRNARNSPLGYGV